MACDIISSRLNIQTRKKICEELKVVPKETVYGKQEDILVFTVTEITETESSDGEFTNINFEDEKKVKEYSISIPFSYYKNNISEILDYEYPNEDLDYPRTSYNFIGNLNTIQNEIKEETYDILNRNRSILISLYCGAGKTFYTIFLASKLKYKTLVLCHRINLIEQWEYSINKTCPDAKVQVLDSRTKIDTTCDFFIMNVTNVCKIPRKDFKFIGLLVADEAHTFCTDNITQSLLWFRPKYLIGLTATPERTDGKSKILDLFFGTERIIRKLYRPFNVYVVNTEFKPTTRVTKMGKLDWHSVLESQSNDSHRNTLIVKIILFFKTRNFLVLCKRRDQADLLIKLLKNNNETDVDIYTGTSKKFNRDSRILISTYSKSGVGFDHPKLDALIIASDVEEGIEQYIGRVFRREDVVPIIFDILDKMHVLFKHYMSRRNIYKSIGGDVKDFYRYFPEFDK